ncbi:unnamed protein product [Clavelina lepadiformis]|uniref:Uncharacterized protein n=1 Tax=Clavelina lepadiformis TaxID=159417 RepID=A0ABP0FQN7_CLALP
MSLLRHFTRNESDASNTDNLEVEPTISSNVAAMSNVQIRESNVENSPMVLGGQPTIKYVINNHPAPQPVAAEGSGNASDRSKFYNFIKKCCHYKFMDKLWS